jgi:hypothetical protein
MTLLFETVSEDESHKVHVQYVVVELFIMYL